MGGHTLAPSRRRGIANSRANLNSVLQNGLWDMQFRMPLPSDCGVPK